MESASKSKKREALESKLRGTVPARQLGVTDIALARIRKKGLRVSVAGNEREAKKEGRKSEVAFSIFQTLKGLFSFFNEKMGAGIPAFDEKKGNVKIATNKTTNVSVVDNKHEVTVELHGKKTKVDVDGKTAVNV